jgi:hypothetical protein
MGGVKDDLRRFQRNCGYRIKWTPIYQLGRPDQIH